jgi:hypothetical protein
MDQGFSIVQSLAFLQLVVGLGGCGTSESTVDHDAGASGSTGTAGNIGSGGAGGSSMVTDGSSGTGGSDVTCSAGTVSFHVSAASGDYCSYSSCGTPGVGASVVVSVKSAAGQEMPLAGDCVTTSCRDCLFHRCDCPAPQRLGPQGQTITWDGTYLQQGTCGMGGGVAAAGCSNKKCATPGMYTATICAYPAVPDAGGCPATVGPAVPTCIDVPFDYPSTAPVEGALGVH